MDGALSNFPSLKTFGGFDPLPDIGREGNTTRLIVHRFNLINAVLCRRRY